MNLPLEKNTMEGSNCDNGRFKSEEWKVHNEPIKDKEKDKEKDKSTQSNDCCAADALPLDFINKYSNWNITKEDKPVFIIFKPKDVKKMRNNCKGNTYLDLRDMAIITMFFETGIRNYELCSIMKDDIKDDYILIICRRGINLFFFLNKFDFLLTNSIFYGII